MTSTETALAVFGALLVGGALISGIARRSFLSLTALFVLAGFALGDGGLGVLEFDPTGGFVSVLAVVALVVILFRDGLEVEARDAPPRVAPAAARARRRDADHRGHRRGGRRRADRPVVDAGVPRRRAAVADRPGALVERRDEPARAASGPPLAQPRVRAQRRPRAAAGARARRRARALGGERLRVVALRAPGRDARLRLRRGRSGSWRRSLLPRGGALAESIPAHQKALYALGVAFLTYGVTTLPPHGNGFIAVYVCAITLGIRRPDIRGYVEARADDIVEIVKLGIFVVFGSLLTVEGLFLDGWAAVAIVVVTLLVARPVALAIALVGTRVSRATLAFMAWFGPKGVATMTFSLLVLGSGVARRRADLRHRRARRARARSSRTG